MEDRLHGYLHPVVAKGNYIHGAFYDGKKTNIVMKRIIYLCALDRLWKGETVEKIPVSWALHLFLQRHRV